MSETSDHVDQIELEITHVPIEQLMPNSWNPNKQSDRVADAQRESIDKFGFIAPILVRPHPTDKGKMQIIDGEHRLTTLADRGYRGTVPVVVRDFSDADAKKLTIVMNETRGDPDQLLLAQLLTDIHAQVDEADFRTALPYSDRELDKLLALAQPEPEPDPGVEAGGGDARGAEAVEHEIKLVYGTDRHDNVKQWLTMLEREFGESAISDVVYEALRRQALQANQRAS